MRSGRQMLLSATAAMALASPAWAQSAGQTVSDAPAAQTPPPAPTDSQIGDDIIVTAQKREQALHEVPQSISVIGSEALDRREARSITDYAALVPGLSIEQGNPGNTRVVLRGVNSGRASPTVSI